MPGKTYLLVDDDRDDRELFQEALMQIDPLAKCIIIPDAKTAMSLMRSFCPDIIFADINMPGINGWQLLKSIKQNEILKTVPVYMYSTSSNKADKLIASELGATGFITKPEDFKVLKQTLQALISPTS